MTSGSSNHDKNRTQVAVASFNLLAPLYIRPVDQRTGKIQPFAVFDWISDEDSERFLGNDCRLPKLFNMMKLCGGDFICVQELQLEREPTTVNNTRGQFALPKWIAPLIESSSSYNIILPPQIELENMAERNRRVLLADVAITNGIFYRADKWSPICKKEGGIGANNTTSCVTQAFLPVDSEQGNDIDNEPIVITSIHLDACSEEKRVQQLQRCLVQSISYSTTPYIPPCVIAGDYNAELFKGSCVNAFLAKHDEPDGNISLRKKECRAALRLPSSVHLSEDQMDDWDALHNCVTKFIHHRFLTLDRIDTGCTRVAYDHDEDPSTLSDQNQRAMAQWRLDHILYTPSTLMPLGKWSTLEDDEHSRKVGLPNDSVPTDHLPISALFEMQPHPRLSEESKETLTELFTEMENKQILELETMNTEAEQKRVDLEHKHGEKKKDELIETQPQPTKSKKKKVRPPMEIIQHIQMSREMIRELKRKHIAERGRFISSLTMLEKMVLQSILGRDITCIEWAESRLFSTCR
ncbi:hypothetical protein ACHAXR_010218 [Thalassiosira sp. AJA248-18]